MRRRALIRRILSDAQWEQVAPLLPGKPSNPGRSNQDNRGFLEGVLWIARTGSPWRDLHPKFGRRNSIFRRFRRWAVKGVFGILLKSSRLSMRSAIWRASSCCRGQRHDSLGVEPLIPGVAIGALLADNAFDSSNRYPMNVHSP
jgi:transposase